MKRPFVLALALACSGCQLLFSLDDVAVRDASGGETDATDADSANCYGTGDLVVCPAQPLPETAPIPPTVNTDDDVCLELVTENPDICVLGARTVAIDSVRATGKLPLVIIGDTVTIEQINVSSGPGVVGAGARKPCPFGGDAQTGAGGAGGSHGEIGGYGGTGTGVGGIPLPNSPSRMLRGGCPGQQGSGGAFGGSGGGALAVLANTILITGPINASGAGGTGGANAAGGGGGGAGGMIYLDAPTLNLDVNGRVFANGGGGGQGGQGDGTPGASGHESTGPTNPGAGGANAGGGEAGGDGGYKAVPAMTGSPVSAGVGAGGGGGAVGVTRVVPNPLADPDKVSPQPTP